MYIIIDYRGNYPFKKMEGSLTLTFSQYFNTHEDTDALFVFMCKKLHNTIKGTWTKVTAFLQADGLWS